MHELDNHECLIGMVADCGPANVAKALAGALRALADSAETEGEATEFRRCAEHAGRAGRACETGAPA